FASSTTVDAALTTTVSSIVPTFRSGLTVAVNCAGSSMPSRFTDEKPGSVNVTVHTPGRKSVSLYWPGASVVAVRTRSISAGLAASTVTPGSTAPLVSRTTPAMPVVCANATCVETTYAKAAMQDRRTYLRIATSLVESKVTLPPLAPVSRSQLSKDCDGSAHSSIWRAPRSDLCL